MVNWILVFEVRVFTSIQCNSIPTVPMTSQSIDKHIDVKPKKVSLYAGSQSGMIYEDTEVLIITKVNKMSSVN